LAEKSVVYYFVCKAYVGRQDINNSQYFTCLNRFSLQNIMDSWESIIYE